MEPGDYREGVRVTASQATCEALGVIILAAAERENDSAYKQWMKVVGRHLWGARDGERIWLAGRESAYVPAKVET
jgi:hypothetical protein